MLPALDDNEDDPVRLWAEIHRLRCENKGPDGFATWMDAAVDERRRRVALQAKVDTLLSHLVWLLQDTWPYLHNWCTIESVKARWQKAHDYVGNFHS